MADLDALKKYIAVFANVIAEASDLEAIKEAVARVNAVTADVAKEDTIAKFEAAKAAEIKALEDKIAALKANAEIKSEAPASSEEV